MSKSAVPTIDRNENPLVADVGTPTGDCTIITSGVTTGTVLYKIEEISARIGDEQVETFVVNSNFSEAEKYPQIVNCNATELKIILKSRTHYQVCVKDNSKDYSDWVTFWSKDKTYVTPGAISELRVEYADAANGVQITVTNTAYAQEEIVDHGSHVTNSYTGYAGTTEIEETAQGATVYTDSFFKDKDGNAAV